MRAILLSVVLLTSSAWAAEADERAAVERTIAAFNDHSRPASTLFTADAEGVPTPQIWSELSTPHFTISSVRFLKGKIAVVDGYSTQFGSLILRRSVPAQLVLKKVKKDWRIASVHGMG